VTSWLLLPFHGLFLLISLAILVVELFALIDAAIRPEASYRATGKQSKPFWLAVLGVALALTLFGGGGFGFLGIAALVAAIVYLVDVRPRLREVRRGGSSSSGPYGPW
jgi:hypothetical protein